VLQLLVTANVVPSSLILSIQLVFLRSVLQLLGTANVVPSSPIVVSVIIDAIVSSVTSVITRATGRHIQEDGISARRMCDSSGLLCDYRPYCFRAKNWVAVFGPGAMSILGERLK
jgi:hypothetical protein